MDDKLTFLDVPEGAAETIAVTNEPVVEAAVEPQSGQPRGADGKFAAKEPEAAPAVAAPPEPPPAPAPAPAAAEPAAQPPVQPEPKTDPTHVPLAAMLDERDKRKAAEERTRGLEEQIRQQQARNQPQPQVPDRYTDPDAYEAYQQQQIDFRLLNERLNFSERFARKEHGAEVVDQAKAWAVQRKDSDPVFAQRIQNEADPYEFVVAEYKRDQLLAKFEPSDWDQFQQWKAIQAGGPALIPASTPYAPPNPPPTPPRSIASQPSAGGTLKPGEQPVGPGIAFGQIFK